ncbi:MAG: carboxypeptidase-like regulatory domain-containing protein [Candidatus Methanoperedens sp.]|nr:carboxypeptidase-like regulatory domain-containing protein [Candidatus Methanoperedens sp.]
MKIFENITNGYRKIASGIAIVAFLALLYFALIPAGTIAASFIATASGDPIVGAFIKLVDYPQYNTTSGAGGVYALNNVPYDGLGGGSTYSMRTRATGYALNTTTVFINGPTATKNVVLTPGYKITAPGQIYLGQWRTNFLVGNLGTQPTTLDVNYIDLSGVTVNNSEDVISTMASKEYTWSQSAGSIEGSSTITSEQPIDALTIQRSNNPGKTAYFMGTPLNIEQTQWFVPGQIYAGQWRTGFKTLNLGTINADVSLYFYNSTGGLIRSLENVIIPPKAAPYYDWNTYAYIPSGQLSSAAEGTVVVISNNAQPISITASMASEVPGKTGFWNGIYMNNEKTDIFVTGQIFYDPQWRSGFKPANIGTINANVSMYFYNSAGALINSILNIQIPPKSSPYYDWYSNAYLPSGGLAHDGTVRIISNNGVPLYVIEQQSSELPGFTDYYEAKELNGNNTAGLIYLKYEGGERSGFKIANPNDTPLTVDITFYNAAGNPVNTITSYPVPAKTSPYFAWNAYTPEPSGSVTVIGTNRISVVGSFASDIESKMGSFKGING